MSKPTAKRKSRTVGTAKTKSHSDQRFVSGRSNILRADDVRQSMPLFQSGSGGESPTSALQLKIVECEAARAMQLNRLWHSRLPETHLGNLVGKTHAVSFVAEFDDVAYAVGIWSSPIAMAFNGKNYLELRRLAVCDEAPKFTATRMLRVMRLLIEKKFPEIVNLISYQDTSVHAGTIYKAAGWVAKSRSRVQAIRWRTRGKNRPAIVATGEKIRWEYAMRKSANAELSDGPSKT